jgi:hypothetical protein
MQALEPRRRARIMRLLDLVTERGHAIAEPLAKPIHSSRHAPNVWELRWDDRAANMHLRVLIAFHRDHVVALYGGDKTGNWDDWYRVAVPNADLRFDHYLRRHKETDR